MKNDSVEDSLEGKSYFPQRPVINKNRANTEHMYMVFSHSRDCMLISFSIISPSFLPVRFLLLYVGERTRVFFSCFFSGKRNWKKTKKRGAVVSLGFGYLYTELHMEKVKRVDFSTRKKFFGRSQFGKAK